MIAATSSGRRFHALARYLVHGRPGAEPDRVAWTAGRNLPTDDPQLAATFMEATARQNVRVEKPVYHLSISFDPTDAVTRETMERVADRVLQELGLTEYQAVLVAHQDREHPHVHIMVNRIHPETGLAWERWQDRPRIERVLREEERALGLRVVAGRLYQLPGQEPPERSVLTPGEYRRATESGEMALPERLRDLLPWLREARSWTELHAELAAHGLRIERKGQGLVITDGERYVKASRVARDLSLRRLEAKFGLPYHDRDDLSPQRGRPLSHAAAELVVAVRTYERGLALERERHQAERELANARASRATSAGTNSAAAATPPPIETQTADHLSRIAKRIEALDNEIDWAPSKVRLAHTIGRALDRLESRELRQLRRVLTAPHVAFVFQVRETLRDIALGRDDRERGWER